MPQLEMQEQKSITLLLFLILVIIATLADITADMYVPSLPAITQALNSSPSAVQLTLSFYLMGFGLAHLVYGPLSDRIGRRKPLLFGISLAVIGGVTALFANSVWVLIIGRFLQGCGLAACNAIGRALMRDVLSGTHLARIGSLMGMAMVFVMAASPTLGGYLQRYFSWRATFLVLSAYTAIVWLILYFKLPETNRNLNPTATRIKMMAQNYSLLIRNSLFMSYTLCTSFAYAGILSYLTAAPFLLQQVVGLTPVQFGWLSFVVGGAIFTSAYINSQMVMKKGIANMVLLGICCMLSGSLLMLLFASLGKINTVVIMLPVAIFCLGAGLCCANAQAGALLHVNHIAGIASALYGCFQIITAALTSSIVAILHEVNQMPLALMLSILSLLSLLFWIFGIYQQKHQDT
jgi:Bcr/CflA subfamily drug resistance transporter